MMNLVMKKTTHRWQMIIDGENNHNDNRNDNNDNGNRNFHCTYTIDNNDSIEN